MSVKINNIEFDSTSQGDITINDGGNIRTYREDDYDFTDVMFEYIENNYPEALAGYSSWFEKLKGNMRYFKYRVVFQFLSCNATGLDNAMDIDENEAFNIEHAHCPIRKTCKYNDVCCHPKRNTNLSGREYEVMSLYYEGYKTEDIAEILFISPKTVIRHKHNSLFKLNVKGGLPEFLVIARQRHLFK